MNNYLKSQWLSKSLFYGYEELRSSKLDETTYCWILGKEDQDKVTDSTGPGFSDRQPHILKSANVDLCFDKLFKKPYQLY